MMFQQLEWKINKRYFSPSENIVEMKDGKRKLKKKFFPGYLLVRLEMDKETKYLLENVNGVITCWSKSTPNL